MYQILKYIQFFFKRNKKNPLNSSFDNHEVLKCFFEKTSKSKVTFFIKVKNELKLNQTLIEITDFGAGSRAMKTNQRKVSDITKNAGMTVKNAKLLINFIEIFNLKNILEIGTSVGLGTYCLANNNNVKVTTLEGCPNTLQFAKENLTQNNIKNVHFVLGDFNETLQKTINNNTYDLIYFDGNHQKEPTIQYFKQCLNAIHNNSILIFDDIYWSKEMCEAWNFIKNHPKVSFTIDTFYWGIVFIRESVKKEHFKIKLA